MKAIVYGGPGVPPRWTEVPDPELVSPTDAIVRIDTTTICGTDLHILKGDVAAVTPGRILGHEGVGTITSVGDSVSKYKVGDRVIISCISSCGSCAYCKRGMQSHCQGLGGIGWVFGHLIDGTQAEYVRVPFADNTLHAAPGDVSDDELVFLSDIYPTGYEIGVKYGGVKDGDIVAVIGVGPVGLAAVATAKLDGAAKVIAVGRQQPRIDHALKMGADIGVSTKDPDWVAKVMAQTDGLGVDVVVEAVGIPATLQDCFRIVRPGGHVANAGVHGCPVEIPMQEAWISNLTITTGLVDSTTIPELLEHIRAGRLEAWKMGTHSFTLDEFERAYEVFSNAAEHDALKVIVRRR